MLCRFGFYILFAVFFAADALAAADGKTAPPPSPHLTELPAPKEFARPDALVSTEALAKLLPGGRSKLVLIDARGRAAFNEGHVPGALNIESDTLQDPERPPYYMPTREVLAKVCAQAQISADSRVAIYDEDDGRLAARVWFTLHAYGHNRVAILDGGAGKWCNEGRPWTVEATPPPAARGTFEPAATLRGVCTFAELPQFRVRVHTLGRLPPTTLLDARSLAEYMGEDVRGKVGGHIPGAANIEWSAMLTGKERARVWRSPPEIHTILRMGGLEREQKIAVYDQAGGRSGHLYFTLWLMGFENAANYVAGWREYGNRDDVEVEK
ncbi:MAG: rhodanese-like domain-containing protein [Planctomycetota bacterium]|nr:rhodanese-like domain-containing protein [Planctomycetota bacterium]